MDDRVYAADFWDDDDDDGYVEPKGSKLITSAQRDRVDQALTKSLIDAPWDSAKVDESNFRPRLTAKNTRQLATGISGKVRRFRPLEETNIFDFVSIVAPPSLEQSPSAMEIDLVFVGQTERQETRIRDFYRLLTSINQVSSRALIYLESYTTLRLDSDKTEVLGGRPFTTKGKGSEKEDSPARVSELHPWQVIGIVWLIEML